MDAIDVNWCLYCECHTEGGAAYCSRECLSAHNSSTSSIYAQPIHHSHAPHHHYRTTAPQYISEAEDDELEEEHDDDDAILQYRKAHLPPSKGDWIGRGLSGIQDWAKDVEPGLPAEPEPKPRSITSGFRPPKILHSYRRPLPPTLCTTKTEPAPPQPSRPIFTPQQSLPSASSRSATNASLTSLTTGISTSIATPASEDPEDPPSAETHRPNFIGTLTAHLRPWATSTSKDPKSTIRSKTVTRRREPTIVTVDSRPLPMAQARRHRAYSPVSLFPVDFHPPNEKVRVHPLREKVEQSASRPSAEEHAAYRARGRKLARIVS
ncbi:unnamed protein product [Somion occarium]|uniref:Uncharacterized protein n=1 Tax=Somion occarium TaxID=3059160 RepID=A0ABP1E646_9APHY